MCDVRVTRCARGVGSGSACAAHSPARHREHGTRGGECQVGPVAARLQRARTEYAELSLASLRDCVAQMPFFSEIRMSRIEKLFITK